MDGSRRIPEYFQCMYFLRLAKMMCASVFILLVMWSYGFAQNSAGVYVNGHPLFLRTFEEFDGNSRLPSRKWDDLIGKEVVVEGFVWGGKAKPPAPYVTMIRAILFIDSEEYAGEKMHGKPVRVFGKLQATNFEYKDSISGKSRPGRRFSLKPTRCKVLKKVAWPYMRQQKYYFKKKKGLFD